MIDLLYVLRLSRHNGQLWHHCNQQNDRQLFTQEYMAMHDRGAELAFRCQLNLLHCSTSVPHSCTAFLEPAVLSWLHAGNGLADFMNLSGGRWFAMGAHPAPHPMDVPLQSARRTADPGVMSSGDGHLSSTKMKLLRKCNWQRRLDSSWIRNLLTT